jgi:hypothetical protein
VHKERDNKGSSTQNGSERNSDCRLIKDSNRKEEEYENRWSYFELDDVGIPHLFD